FVTYSTLPTKVGNLTAIVTTDGVSSGTAVQIGTVVSTWTQSTGSLPANAAQITISGSGFDTTGTNTVTFNDGAVGTVVAVTPTSLTVGFTTKPTTAGPLKAVVLTDGFGAGQFPVQVATVTPVVTANTSLLRFNASQITINGFGFDTTAVNN